MPIEIPAILEFLDQPGRIESVLRLPEFLHDEAADACLIERPCGEHAEIVDVTRLVALIAGANFFGENFRQRETDDLCRREPQQLEIICPICARRWVSSVGVSRRLIWSLTSLTPHQMLLHRG